MDKVFEPITISDVPLPGDSVITQNPATSGDSSTAVTSTPQNVSDTIIPTKIVAHETIGETLNTKARKIQGAYSFTQQGSIEVGVFQPGVSGDVRITPDGITARDNAGNTTFNLDGDTGDAEFAGTLRGGTVIGGNNSSVVIQESQAGNGRIVLYRGGLPSIIIGDPNG